jgi:hypothetical protein
VVEASNEGKSWGGIATFNWLTSFFFCYVTWGK